MKSTPIVSAVHRWLIIPLLLATCLSVCPGQETKSTKSAAATTEKKQRAKPRGRLPAYFSRVVSALQREKIYAIQKTYRAQIEKLQQQLADLTRQQDKEVLAVLTDEQRDKVAQLQEEARKRRSNRSKSRTAARDNDTSGDNE